MLGAELNAAIQEEWPAPATHARRLRWWLKEKAESLNGSSPAKEPAVAAQPAATIPADGDATS
jgi:membrane protein